MRHNITARATQQIPTLLVGDSPDFDKVAEYLDSRGRAVFRYTAAEADLATTKIEALAAGESTFAVSADENSVGLPGIQKLVTAVKSIPKKRGSTLASLSILSATSSDSTDRETPVRTFNTQNRTVEYYGSSGEGLVDRVIAYLGNGNDVDIPKSLLLAAPATGYEGNVTAGASTPNGTERQAYIKAYQKDIFAGYPFNLYKPDQTKMAAQLVAPVQVLICDTGADWKRANNSVTLQLQGDLMRVGIPTEYIPVFAADVLMASLAKVRKEGRQAVVIDVGAMGWWHQVPFKEDSLLRLIEKKEPNALRIFVRDHKFGTKIGEKDISNYITTMNPTVLSAAAHATIPLANEIAIYTAWRKVVASITQLMDQSQRSPTPNRSASTSPAP